VEAILALTGAAGRRISSWRNGIMTRRHRGTAAPALTGRDPSGNIDVDQRLAWREPG